MSQTPMDFSVSRQGNPSAMFKQNPVSVATAALCLLLALSACQSFEPIKEPQLRLVNIEIEELKLLEQKFILHLDVYNPNDPSPS